MLDTGVSFFSKIVLSNAKLINDDHVAKPDVLVNPCEIGDSARYPAHDEVLNLWKVVTHQDGASCGEVVTSSKLPPHDYRMEPALTFVRNNSNAISATIHGHPRVASKDLTCSDPLLIENGKNRDRCFVL